MKKYFILSLVYLNLQSTMTYAKPPIMDIDADSYVKTCYVRFPFLLSALAEISDHDFLDEKKSMERTSELVVHLNKSSNEIQLCVDKILSLAMDNKSSETLTFVSLRMSEVRSLLLQKKLVERNSFVKKVIGYRLLMDFSKE